MKHAGKEYDVLFYKGISERAFNSAHIILPLVMNMLPKINSAVDFGCGMGVWLSVLQKLGCQNIKGLDGEWVDKEALYIKKEEFKVVSFEERILPESKYDLVISLEVAEHLSERVARQFIYSLTEASDFVLFSAAIPFQGGTNHINEQWPDYWNGLFNERGYIGIDCLRRVIWNEPKVSFSYKQNILLFVKNESLDLVCPPPPPPPNNIQYFDICINHPPCNLVHYEKYLQLTNSDIYRMSFFRIVRILIGRILRKMFGQKFIVWIKKILKKV